MEQVSAEKQEIEKLIDSTIIAALKENNIFEEFISIKEIRNKLLTMVQHIEYADMSETGNEGCWKHYENKIVLSYEYKDNLENSIEAKETLIHELLHALSEQDYSWNHSYKGMTGKRYTGIKGRYYENDSWQEDTGIGFNEGITEYLAQLLCSTQKDVYDYDGIKFNNQGSYELEQTMIKQMMILFGKERFISAYLHGTEPIEEYEKYGEEYIELRENFDYINKCRSHKYRLPLEKKDEIDEYSRKMANTFIQSQEYFLEHCLMQEINSISTLEEAEEFKIKLKELNALGIKIEGNEKSNYEKYNFMFVRKYLQIVNKDKSYEEQVKFEDVEKYLLSDGSDLITTNSEIKADKKIGWFDKLKESIMSKFLPTKDEFIAIDRGEDDVIYVKECGKEVIAGNKVSCYEYLTEEDYDKYKAGDETVKGQILRGNIDLKKIKKDKEYAYHLGHDLLSADRLDERTLNYNGYIGGLNENYEEDIIPEVQERFEEIEKYIKISPLGMNEDRYIVEDLRAKDDQVKNYRLLTKETIEEIRSGERFYPSIYIKGKIDLEKIQTDKKYKEALEKELLNSERISSGNLLFEDYIGELKSNGYDYYAYNDPKYLEEFSRQGVNGEEKEQAGYYKIVGEEAEKYEDRRTIFKYEFTTKEEMQKMWADSNYANNKEKIIVLGLADEPEKMQLKDLDNIVYQGGYIGKEESLIEKYKNKHYIIEDSRVVVWETGENIYVSPNGQGSFKNRQQIDADIDIERMHIDKDYEKNILETVLTKANIARMITEKESTRESIER